MKPANEILFHPSALGDVMTGTGKGWAVGKSLTCMRYLIKMHREIKHSRYHSHSNKYTEKGIKMEEDGITLYSLFRKTMFKKNQERVKNDYFNGEHDILHGKETIDIKCAWSLETFPHPSVDSINKDYEYQGRAYMDLTGADKHTVAHCLVNAPANLITREQEKLYYNMNCPTLEDGKYLRALIDIEKNMIFDLKQFKSDNPNHDLHCKEWTFDIPMNERVVEFVIKRNDEKIKEIKDRIKECREWMNEHLYKALTPA